MNYKYITEEVKRLFELFISKIDKTKQKNYDLYIIEDSILLFNTYKACLLLYENNMYPEVYMLIRSMYDKLFRIKYVMMNPHNIDQILLSSTVEYRKMINELKTIKSNFSSDYLEKYLSSANDLIDSLKSQEVKELPHTNQLSSIVGMKEDYLNYRYTSNIIHNNALNVIDKVSVDDKSILYHSRENEEDIYLCCVDIVLDLLISLSSNFGLEELYNETNSLVKRIDIDFNKIKR